MRFVYYTIRPCVEHEGITVSFVGEPQWCSSRGDDIYTPDAANEEAEEFRDKHPDAGPVFWTLYGIEACGRAYAIGDFSSFAYAEEIMNAILAPMAAARDAILEQAETMVMTARNVADDLDDFINQCSTEERL